VSAIAASVPSTVAAVADDLGKVPASRQCSSPARAARLSS
jgi:hypothetical protein